jgi:FkbM family methyltransferase
MRRLKQKLKQVYYKAQGFGPELTMPVETVNPGDQAWYFAAGLLKPCDIVYSLGLATNIDFDLNLIKQYRVEIHGFDPTPESVSWIRQQSLPTAFHHHAVAVGGHNGQMVFEPPDKEGGCAREASLKLPPDARTISLPCKTLTSIAAELGHKGIALLKMDVEGSEYAILDDFFQSDLLVRQILVEFHHRFPGFNLTMTKEAVRRLRARGYKLIHLSPWCEEMTFIKP